MKNFFYRILALPEGPPDVPRGSADSAHVFRASPKYLVMRLLSSFVAVVIGVFYFGMDFSDTAEHAAKIIGFKTSLLPVLVLLLLAFLIVVRFIVIYVDYKFHYYIVTDKSIRIRAGALSIHESTFTLENVQNIKLHQGFISRLFGLSDVMIETAGGGAGAAPEKGASLAATTSHTGAIRGVADGEELRARIAGLMKDARTAGLGSDHGQESPRVDTYKTALESIVQQLRITERLTSGQSRIQ